MTKLLLLSVALLLPLTPVTQAAPNEDNHPSAKHRAAAAAKKVLPANPQAARRAVPQRAQQIQRRTTPTLNNQRHFNQARPTLSARTNARSHRPEINRNHNVYTRPVVSNPRGSVNRNNDRGNDGRQADRHRPHRNFDRNSFQNARRHVVHQHHDRDWWRSHYHNTTFVLFGGGYYYQNEGYWYPAFGYSPIYNNYSYSEPIYSYNDLAPGQVLENVQLALRDEGYYDGEIDGLVGPQTRAALAAFQRDNGLEETAAVDEPTLVTLGLA